MTETGNLATTELKTAPDGSFEVILSQQRKGENWLRITDTSNVVLVRGDARLSYQDVADVLAACEAAEIRNVRLPVRPREVPPAAAD